MNRSLLRMLLRWWWLLLGVGAAAACLVFALGQLATPVYRASTRVFINQAQAPGPTAYTDLLASQQLAATYSELTHSGPVLDGTIERLNLQISRDVLDTKITSKVVRETQIVQVSVDDADAARAASIANGLAEVLIARARAIQSDSLQDARAQADREVSEARQAVADTTARLSLIPVGDGNFSAMQERGNLERDLAQKQDRYTRARETQQRHALAQGQITAAATVVSPAVIPAVPVQPTIPRSATLAILAALLAVAATVAIVVIADDRVVDAEQIRRLGLAHLAVIPKVRAADARVLSDPARLRVSSIADSLRLARPALRTSDARIVCVASTRRYEGATTLAACLATVEAHAGKRVVLVDANLRDPGLHRLFGLDNKRGLSTLVSGSPREIEDVLHEGSNGLHILTSGPAVKHPADVFDAACMAELLAHLRSTHDLVIVDGAPLAAVADTAVLQQRVDATILVTNARTGARTLARALDTLQRAGGQILGIVLTQHRPREAARVADSASTRSRAHGSIAYLPERRDAANEATETRAIKRANS